MLHNQYCRQSFNFCQILSKITALTSFIILFLVFILPTSRVNSSEIGYSIYENDGPTTVVANLAEDNNWDGIDSVYESFAKSTKCYNLSSAVEISEVDYWLKTSGPLDREKCEVYEALVVAATNVWTIQLKVLDVNDNEPSFDQPNCFLELDENLGSENQIDLSERCTPKTFLARDNDGPEFRIQSFSIVSGNEAGLFGIEKNEKGNPQTPQPDLTLTRQISLDDASEDGIIMLTIEASDEENKGLKI